MSYLGLQPNTPLLNTSTETFSGDSVSYQFNLGRSIASASDLDVMIGNTLQRPGTDYTANGKTLLFYSPPTTGTNNITVTYRAGALNSLNLQANTFNAGTVAAPGVVSLAANNTGIYWANASSMSVTVSGINRATFNASATSTTNTSGALTVAGGIGATGNINIGGKINIADSTQSSNINSGSITTAGGAGIVGNLNVGGDITCIGDFTVNGTFTTTGADSLAVTDPFIFLANANPGDSFDTGVVAQYFDGANTRYTGYFRDVSDAKYKLFTNLLTKPTTTVDTDDPTFRYTDLILANVSATGNVSGTYLFGNGAFLTNVPASTSANAISNSGSTVIIPASNGNIVGNVNSVTVATIWSGGLAVVGAVSASTTISATANIIGGNIQTAGLFSATGNVTSAGNVSGGNILTGGMTSAVGNVVGGNVNATTAVSAAGNVIGGNVRTVGVVSATGDIFGNTISANTNLTAGADANITANVRSGNVFTTGIVSASGNILGSYFLGNGSQLTGIDTAGVSNGTSNVKVVSSGGNIVVNVGGISNVVVWSTTGQYVTGLVSASGNITGGNLITGGTVQGATLSVTGDVSLAATTQTISIGNSQTTGSIVVGGLTQTGSISIGTGNASQTVLIATGATGTGNTKNVSVGENGLAGSTTNINIGPVTATTAAGIATFNTATRVAIANTGASALSVAGNITGANLNVTGISLTGNVVSAITTASNVTGGNLNATGLSLSGNVLSTLVSAFNITTTANITGGNLLYGSGVVSGAGNITAGTANISGGNILGTMVGNVSFGTGIISGTGNITGGNIIGLHVGSVAFGSGTVSGTGNITGGNILFGSGVISGTGNITSGNLAVGGIVNTNANGVGNIGNSTIYFDTVFAKATSAQYADLAEWYEADADYEPGTVLVFGGDKEVTLAVGIGNVRVAGVVSTNPAHIMNAGLEAKHTTPVALTGRVPTLVIGTVKKGDMMVTGGGGRAMACAEPRMGAVIGKALQDHSGGQGVIEIVVGRM